MQSKAFGESLLAKTQFGTRVEGVDVVMTLGDKACRMDYITAMRLATFLFHSGKVARKNAGGGMLVIGVADLTDAHADELEAQFNRDRTAVFAKVD